MNTLDIIKNHGLALRQIPLVVYSLLEFKHFKEGDEVVVVVEVREDQQRFARNQMMKVSGRRFLRGRGDR